MSKNSTPSSRRSSSDAVAPRVASSMWGSEKILLFCLLGLGLVGLMVTYSGRVTQPVPSSASVNDTLHSEGKLKEGHMILNLNQRTTDGQKSAQQKPTQF